MLKNIIRFSVNNKLLVAIFVLALVAWGIYSVKQLPIDAVPDITNNQVQILTVSPSNGAEDIERFITFPIEQTMATIPDLKEIRSFSRFGLSVVTIVFKEHVDVYWGRQQVNERLSQASDQIPAGMGSPEMAPITTGLGEIFQYIVHTKPGYEKKYTAMDLRTIQDWVIRRQLLGVEGVADVSSFGGYLKQYEVALNPEKLRSLNLSIAQVFDALRKNNQNTGGAYIDKNPTAYFVRSIGLIGKMEDIQNIVVQNSSNGTPVLLRDVGEIRYGYATRYGAMTRDDQGEVTGAIVLMLKGANASQVIKKVKARIEQIGKNLPEGVTIEPYLDRTRLVNRAIDTVSRNLVEGALIVIFVLVVFLGNLRAGLIVASVIPLSMLYAISLMQVFGVSGNLMSLGAIDFGLIVDGAVIIVEATMHHLGLRKGLTQLTQPEMDAEVEQSATRMLSSAAFGTIIILVVYLPLLALVGIEGKMFRPMAQTVIFAILGAFLLSLTYVPMMSALFLSRQTGGQKNSSTRIMHFLQGLYTPALQWVLRKPLVVITSVVALFIGYVFVFGRLGAEFIPQLDEGDFAVETRVLTGSSLSKTVEAATQSAALLKKQFPEVKEVVGKIGASEIPTDPMPVEACDLIILLKDKKEWTSAHSRVELASRMQAALEKAIPGVTYGFQQPIQMRFNELIAGARQDVVVKIFGEDLNLLSDYAGRIGNIIRDIKGTADIYIEQVTGLPQIVVTYKRERIAQYGLNVEDINQVIRTGFAGDRSGQVFEGEKRFDLVVRLDTANRKSIEDLRALYVTTASGNQVPLSQLADVELQTGPNQIQREDTRRRIIVGFNVRGRDVESIVNELQDKVNRQVKFQPGYYSTYGGTFENLQEAKGRLGIAVPVALLLIFLLLYFTFHSVKQGLLIFTAIPLSAIGGILALWIRGMPFSISAGVGFIALFGVAVLNGIVLMAEFNRLQQAGQTDLKQVILEGTRVRLRPVIMTATVASLGFLPMAISQGSGAEVQRPLATVVIGGLVTATLLTLLVLPALFLYFNKRKWRISKPATLLLLLAAGITCSTKAQPVKWTLPAAIDYALQHNSNVKAASLELASQKALQGTASEIGKTDFLLNHGQYNSIKTDNSITISQTIPFPTVFAKKAAAGRAMIKSREYRLQLSRDQLVLEIKKAWQQLLFSYALQNLLMQQDTVYAGFLKAASLRYKTGETNLLEKTSVETRRSEIVNRLVQNAADKEIAMENLQALLQTDTAVIPADTGFIPATPGWHSDTASVAGHPLLAMLQQEITVQEKNRQLATAARLPDITLGYYNQSLIGFQNIDGQEKYFGSGKRFQGIQLGLAIPLWSKPYQSRIRATALQRDAAAASYTATAVQLRSQYRQAVQDHKKYQSALTYYQSAALKNASLLIYQARTAFEKGESAFTEYLLALNQAASIRENYLQAVLQYNQNIALIEYLLTDKP